MSETRIPQALALLREQGWCKGQFADGDARCINGALLAVWGVGCAESINHGGFVPDHWAIGRVIADQYKMHSVAGWNDHGDTTFDEVEYVLEKAALERGASL